MHTEVDMYVEYLHALGGGGRDYIVWLNLFKWNGLPIRNT